MIKVTVNPVYDSEKKVVAIEKAVKICGICVYRKTIANLAKGEVDSLYFPAI